MNRIYHVNDLAKFLKVEHTRDIPEAVKKLCDGGIELIMFYDNGVILESGEKVAEKQTSNNSSMDISSITWETPGHPNSYKFGCYDVNDDWQETPFFVFSANNSEAERINAALNTLDSLVTRTYIEATTL